MRTMLVGTGQLDAGIATGVFGGWRVVRGGWCDSTENARWLSIPGSRSF